MTQYVILRDLSAPPGPTFDWRAATSSSWSANPTSSSGATARRGG